MQESYVSFFFYSQHVKFKKYEICVQIINYPTKKKIKGVRIFVVFNESVSDLSNCSWIIYCTCITFCLVVTVKNKYTGKVIEFFFFFPLIINLSLSLSFFFHIYKWTIVVLIPENFTIWFGNKLGVWRVLFGLHFAHAIFI